MIFTRSESSSKIDLDSLEEPTHFQLLEQIGEGTYGEVFAALYVDQNNEENSGNKSEAEKKHYAVKILENLHENMEEAEEELHVLKELSIHPNLPTFHGAYFKKFPKFEDSQLWIVMELCSGGSVTDVVQCLKKFENITLTEKQLAYILIEVVDALIHLHRNKCMHRDVKGHNILLTGDARVKLIDFGVTYQLEHTFEKRNTSIGTPYWMAPEVIACEKQQDSAYDNRCDVWSLGITAIELAEGNPPLSDVHPMRALFQIPRNPPPTLSKSDQWSFEFNDFIGECLVKDMELRPFVAELRSHPFFQAIKGLSIEIARQELISLVKIAKSHLSQLSRQPEVTTKRGKLKVDRKAALKTMFVDNLANLSSLDEETILEQLFNRYEMQLVYTYVGNILIAINPYENLDIYNDQHHRLYRGCCLSDLAPHVFGIADSAYHSMLHEKEPQNIIITGESGAGKTETAKFLLQHLVYLGKAPNRNLEAKLLQFNPIMEAFGNALTGVNQNSSRFGKFLDVTYTTSGKITGAKISVYLLEESRIDHQAIDEQNFHIFYYLLDGIQEPDLRSELRLDQNSFAYLTSKKLRPPKKESVRNFQALETSFRTLGFLQDEIEYIFKILAAILHLGEINFQSNGEADDSFVSNSDTLGKVALLLGVSGEDLDVTLRSRTVVTHGDSFSKAHSCLEAKATRDALARGLYSRLFRWIVNQINGLLCVSRLAYGDPLSIGILDIFGFESRQINSLEQFYINVTNEQLQYYVNQYVFTWEQQEYMAEGVDMTVVHYADNGPILELCLGKPLGILTLIDEESRFQRATDYSLLDKMSSHLGSNSFYHKRKSSADCNFSITHYAGTVHYSAKNFLRKNRQWHSPDLIHLMRNSENDIVNTIYRCLLTKTGDLYVPNRRESITQLAKEGDLGLLSQTRSHRTLSTTFRHSLHDLMSKLLCGQPHFIRCIKPNVTGAAKTFDHHQVLTQLRYSGMFETLQIRQLGYSHRFSFVEFLKRYCFLAFNFDERVVADRESCRLLLVRLKLDGWALGKTKVFLRYYHVEYLAKLCEKQIKSIIYVQACVRRWLARLKYKRGMYEVAKTVLSAKRAAKIWMGSRKRSSEIIQLSTSKKRGSWLRARVLGVEEVVFPDEEQAAVLIQSRFRGYIVRKKWGPILEKRIQNIIMTNTAEEDAAKALQEEGIAEEDAALILQRFYRKWKVQQSQDQGNLEQDELSSSVVASQNWDAPFRQLEKRMREIRRGDKRKREKVDMASYRRQLIVSGLKSQNLANKEREQVAARRWGSVVGGAAPNIPAAFAGKRVSSSSNKGPKISSKVFPNPRSDNESIPKKYLAAVPPSLKTNNSLVTVRQLGGVAGNQPIDIPPPSEDCQGPVNFRKLLRKTAHGPTASLKKRWSAEEE